MGWLAWLHRVLVLVGPGSAVLAGAIKIAAENVPPWSCPLPPTSPFLRLATCRRMPSYATRAVGSKYTNDYRLYIGTRGCCGLL